MFLWINRYYSLVKSIYTIVTLLLSFLWETNVWTKPRIRNSTSVTSDNFPFLWGFTMSPFFMQKNSIDCSPFYPVHNLFDPYSSLWVKTKSFMLCSAADKTENSSSGIRSCFFYYDKLSLNILIHINFLLVLFWCGFRHLDTL